MIYLFHFAICSLNILVFINLKIIEIVLTSLYIFIVLFIISASKIITVLSTLLLIVTYIQTTTCVHIFKNILMCLLRYVLF